MINAQHNVGKRAIYRQEYRHKIYLISTNVSSLTLVLIK